MNEKKEFSTQVEKEKEKGRLQIKLHVNFGDGWFKELEPYFKFK